MGILKSFFYSMALLLLPLSAWADCTSPDGVESQTIYDTNAHAPKFCNGTSWRTLEPWQTNPAGINYSGGYVAIGPYKPTQPFEIEHGFSFHNSGHKVISFVSTPYIDWDDTLYAGEIRFNPLVGVLSFGISGTLTSIANRDVFKLYNTGDVTITGALTQNSDRRLKKQIIPLKDALGHLAQIRGVRFHWKEANKDQDAGEQVGLIAQEVGKVYPQLVRVDAQGVQSLNYQGLVAPLIEAVKTLDQRVKTLEAAQ